MKETDGWIKIKKYTDDDGKPVCWECCLAPLDYKQRPHPLGCGFSTIEKTPGPLCPIWHAESKSEWQPIETAPKDCPVLVYAPGKEGLTALISTCKWHYQAGFCIDEIREPTHWMPLPSPPQEEISAIEISSYKASSDIRYGNPTCEKCGITYHVLAKHVCAPQEK